ALALLGTVTGYYLGRVPAELHAQQAQRAANTAQQQLQSTQSQLTDTAGSAAQAATQLSVAQTQKEKAERKVQDAKTALASVSQTMGQKLADADVTKKATLMAGRSSPPDDASLEDMRRAKDEIDRLLQQMGS